jgi:hypothetical protein
MLNNLIRGNNLENAIIPNVINKDSESANPQIVFKYRAISNRTTDFDTDRNRNPNIEILKFIHKRLLLADLHIFSDMKNQRDEILFVVKLIDFHEINTQSV